MPIVSQWRRWVTLGPRPPSMTQSTPTLSLHGKSSPRTTAWRASLETGRTSHSRKVTCPREVIRGISLRLQIWVRVPRMTLCQILRHMRRSRCSRTWAKSKKMRWCLRHLWKSSLPWLTRGTRMSLTGVKSARSTLTDCDRFLMTSTWDRTPWTVLGLSMNPQGIRAEERAR